MLGMRCATASVGREEAVERKTMNTVWDNGALRIRVERKGRIMLAPPDVGTPLVLVPAGPLCEVVLAAAGIPFSAVRSPLEDPPGLIGRVNAVEAAEALAYYRARSVADRQHCRRVLGISTLVRVGDHVFGPPPGRLEAAAMLHAVSGREHSVVTGVALLDGTRRLLAADVTSVAMRPIPGREIDRYLASGGWLGIAGAYATPEMAERFVARRDGSFSNLLGVPVELVLNMLAEIGEHPNAHRTPALASA